jgi:hypothetical protein
LGISSITSTTSAPQETGFHCQNHQRCSGSGCTLWLYLGRPPSPSLNFTTKFTTAKVLDFKGIQNRRQAFHLKLNIDDSINNQRGAPGSRSEPQRALSCGFLPDPVPVPQRRRGAHTLFDKPHQALVKSLVNTANMTLARAHASIWATHQRTRACCQPVTHQCFFLSHARPPQLYLIRCSVTPHTHQAYLSLIQTGHSMPAVSASASDAQRIWVLCTVHHVTRWSW